MPEVRVRVAPGGDVTMDYQGFRGPSCLQAAEALKKLLAKRYGVTVVDEQITNKPEMDETLVAEAQQESAQVQREGA